MSKCDELKNKVDLLNYIEGVCGQKAFKAGSDTYRFKKCPLCGGGNHFDVTSKNLFNTWGKCGRGSIIDFYMAYYGKDQKTAIDALCEEFNISGKVETVKTVSTKVKTIKEVKTNGKQAAKLDKVVDLTPNVLNYFTTKDSDYSYFRKRLLNNDEYCIDVDIMRNYDRLIFDNKIIVANPNSIFPDEHIPVKKEILRACECIIPVWKNGKVVNALLKIDYNKCSDWGKKNLAKYLNLKGLSVEIFNIDYLKSEKLIFVTEGIFDCLSLEMLGYKSIALNSVNMVDEFVERVKSDVIDKASVRFVLCLDNDKKGIEAYKKISNALKCMGINFFSLHVPLDEGKDINEWYLSNLEGLKAGITNILMPRMESSYIDTYRNHISENKKRKPVSTGFEGIDLKLNGGLYPGLYTLGAISSLGKTALTLQIADNIAASGQCVLFFSLEMPKDELISRSISRMMYDLDPDKCSEVNTIRVLNGQFDDCIEEFELSLEQYETTTARHLQIVQGDFNMSAMSIVDYVQNFINSTGIKPIVFIDYLQIVKANLDKAYSEKQGVDDVVVKFKMLSRDFNIPVFVVSSFNRENYNSPCTFNCFKESGSIEYTSDFVLGLQLSELDPDDSGNSISDTGKKAQLNEKLNEAKSKEPREITLVVLKNRNGKSFSKQKLLFYPKNNMFEECGGAIYAF